MNFPQSDFERRFGGVARLYGADALARFQSARIGIIGLGGVGAWACEALARSAVGHLTLIDLDMIALSNTNRQIHALGDAYGQSKVDAMRQRVLAINPDCNVKCIEDFVSLENLAHLIQKFDIVIDAIDEVKIKAALAAHCRDQNLRLIMCGAAGGQTDPSCVRSADLTRAEQDALLARVRKQLRTRYSFPRDIRRKFNIPCVYSIEPVRYPEAVCATNEMSGEIQSVEIQQSDADVNLNHAPAGLSCAGYGSSVSVTATFGFFAAAQALKMLTE